MARPRIPEEKKRRRIETTVDPRILGALQAKVSPTGSLGRLLDRLLAPVLGVEL